VEIHPKGDAMSGPLDLVNHALKSFIPSQPIPRDHSRGSLPADVKGTPNNNDTNQDQLILPGHLGVLDEAAKTRLSERRDNLILKYHSATSGEDKLSQSFTIAFLSTVLGNVKDFTTWAETAITNAGQLPGGTELAVPTIKGDLHAVSGKYLEAIHEYKNALGVIEELEGAEIDVQEQKAAVQNRMQQVWFSYAYQQLAQMKDKYDIEARGRAVGAMKEIYRMAPSEGTLTAILSVYTSSGWDIGDLQRNVAGTEKYIQDFEGRMASQFLMTGDLWYLDPTSSQSTSFSPMRSQ